MKKVIVFGSGNGSNFEAIVKYFQGREIEFLCVSDKPNAYIFDRAKKLGIKSFFVPFSETYNFLVAQTYDIIVLAGYMRILTPEVVAIGKMINIHPSLLPEYKGKDALQRAYNAGEKATGVTVHYVNENVDEGETIAQVKVNIEDNMTLQCLESKIHSIEHQIYPMVIDYLLFKTPLKINAELVTEGR